MSERNSNEAVVHIPLKWALIISVAVFGSGTVGDRVISAFAGEPTRHQVLGISLEEHKALLLKLDNLDNKVNQVQQDIAQIRGALWDGHVEPQPILGHH